MIFHRTLPIPTDPVSLHRLMLAAIGKAQSADPQGYRERAEIFAGIREHALAGCHAAISRRTR